MFIFLNGSSSSGKTSIAKELQEMFPQAFLRVGIDAFMGMMPEKFIGDTEVAREGFFFEATKDEHGPITNVHGGVYAKRLFEARVPCIREILKLENEVVIDEILFDGRPEIDGYINGLKGFPGYFIAVNCSLEEVERREKLRENRSDNHARGHYHIIHNHGVPYDFEVDTTSTPSDVCAKAIFDFIATKPEPKVFR
ncbi:hypothetical protein HOD08_00235 [bacterium]|jgi:chloramphenicol 3-O phosphotransferase|nr:hypothetical protein [bacterium]